MISYRLFDPTGCGQCDGFTRWVLFESRFGNVYAMLQDSIMCLGQQVNK